MGRNKGCLAAESIGAYPPSNFGPRVLDLCFPGFRRRRKMVRTIFLGLSALTLSACASTAPAERTIRSEEHTSELQSLMRISYAVFCLKKKKQPQNSTTKTTEHRQKNDNKTQTKDQY